MKIPYGQTEFEGCKFFQLEDVIECTYDHDFNVKKFFVDRVEVTSEKLDSFLRVIYDTQELFNDIVRYELASARIKSRQKKSLENTRPGNPIFNRG